MIKFCSLYSGSSGNSIYLGTKSTHILVDAGVSGIRIAKALTQIGENPEEVGAILVTHEHSDHIKGAGIFSRKYNVPIYARKRTWEAMRGELGTLSDRNICVIGEPVFEIGDVKIRNYSIPHDAVDPVAYTFFAENKKISIATDLGKLTEEIYDNVLGSNIVLLESNHDIKMLQNGPYPIQLKQRILGTRGHLSNENAADFVTKLVRSGTKNIYLGHLSKENNCPELAFAEASRALCKCGMEIDKDVHICVASRDGCSEVITI